MEKIPVLTENRNAVGHSGFQDHSRNTGGATHILVLNSMKIYRSADKSLARPGMKQTTATED